MGNFQVNAAEIERKAIGKWFRDERKKRDLKQQDIADKLKVTLGAASNYENRGIGQFNAMQQAKKLGWDFPGMEHIRDKYLGGRPAALIALEQNEEDETTIPLTSAAASMGFGLQSDEYEVLSKVNVSRPWLATKTTSKNLALLPVTGRSMEPTYRSGDTLLVDRSIFSFDRDGVYAFRSPGGLFVKRITLKVMGGVTVSSDNPEYKDQELEDHELEDVQVLGLVVGVWGYKDL